MMPALCLLVKMVKLASPITGTKTRPKVSSSVQQAKEMQRIALNDCRNPKVKPHIRAALMRAWCDLEERVRVLKMKPLPKSVDVAKLKAEQRAARAARRPAEPNWIETPPATDPPTAA